MKKDLFDVDGKWEYLEGQRFIYWLGYPPSDCVTRGGCLFISENRHYGVIEKYIIHLFKKVT